MEQKPSPCRIVLYRLNASDVARIVDLRRGYPDRTSAHGADVGFGDQFPMVIVRVWQNEFGDGIPGVNGQVLLDGNDSLWVTPAREGNEPGQWSWPPRV